MFPYHRDNREIYRSTVSPSKNTLFKNFNNQRKQSDNQHPVDTELTFTESKNQQMQAFKAEEVKRQWNHLPRDVTEL